MKRNDLVAKAMELGVLIKAHKFEEDEIFRVQHGEYRSPFEKLVEDAMDMDQWKHSWHTEVSVDNAEKIQEILAEKILKRAEEIKKLSKAFDLTQQYKTRNQLTVTNPKGN